MTQYLSAPLPSTLGTVHAGIDERVHQLRDGHGSFNSARAAYLQPSRASLTDAIPAMANNDATFWGKSCCA